jgi:glycosyltransferase involved in cell wall biosynthesis
VTDDASRAVIAPLAPHVVRPRWSVMIPTYHCARYLADTLRSVLAQDPGPDEMQIEVVDDHSTKDDPEAVVVAVAGDRVAFFRQSENRGHAANFDTCLQRSRGRLVHLLHGDDAVREGFYATMQRAFDEQPAIGAAFCRTIYMDSRGQWTHFSPLLQRNRGEMTDGLALIAARQPAQPPSIVVRRDVYERLGGFDHRLRTCAEDWEMYTRIAAHYPIWHEPELLALYRRHPHSLTRRGIRSGQNARDARLAIATYKRHAPTMPSRITRQARELAAQWMLMVAREARDARDDAAWLRQMWEAVRTSPSRAVLRRGMREAWAQGRAVLARAVPATPNDGVA